MRWLLALESIVCATALISCGGGNTSLRPTSVSINATFATEDGTATEQLLADYKNYLRADFKVTYSTSIEGGGKRERQTVTWFKKGLDSQRFDFEGNKNYHYFARTSVFTKGFKDRTVMCSDELPATPTDEDGSGPRGACCEGSSSCGDLAANIIVILGFPLGFEAGAIDALTTQPLDDTTVLLSRRTIAGAQARCYSFSPKSQPDLEGGSPREACFAANGAMLSWNKGYLGDVVVEATSIGIARPTDFNYPYAVYLDPNESR